VASDGLEAVQKAEELRPDLVLFDVGLPNLNGFDAARQLAKLLPGCKVLFVSAEFDSELVQEALLLGAKGYVAKASVSYDLVKAVETVLRGGQFVSENP
jgi:DNA-binding NarL/FixJ family response regulator